jgi:hypothetical protein
MTRQDKYPSTAVFQYHNANPKGRLTTDCNIRAICTALNLPYGRVVMEMAALQCNTGYDCSSSTGIDKYLQSKGWIKHKQPRKEDNTKYTGKEFCERARPYENYIANIGGNHIVAIVGGKVHDTWDCTHKCIGNYWTKP